MVRSLTALVLMVVIAGCSYGASEEPAPVRAASAATAYVFLPACPTGARPQLELDFAGLPPLVPTAPPLQCLLLAHGSGNDPTSTFVLQTIGGQQIHLYERRGAAPVKPGAAVELRAGSRDVSGVAWHWAVLDNGATTLTAMTNATYVELSANGGEQAIDALADVARTLRPVETVPRPPAAQLCAALPVSPNPFTVAGAFDSNAATIAAWDERPWSPGGPYRAPGSSPWRDRPAAEPVTLCYLDGDFGPARQPPPPPGASFAALPNYDRVVYLVGVERRPVGIVFGWQHSIPIRDPGH